MKSGDEELRIFKSLLISRGKRKRRQERKKNIEGKKIIKISILSGFIDTKEKLFSR